MTRDLDTFEVLHRTILECVGEAVISADIRGHVNLLSPVAETLTGWNEAEALGRPIGEVFRLVNETTRAPLEDPVALVLREGHATTFAEHTLLFARDGAELPVAGRAVLAGGAKDEAAGVVVVFHDQTRELDARRNEYALVESESRLREAEKLAQLGHWFWEVKTGKVEWSEEVFRIFRLDPHTFVPRIDSIMALSPWPEEHERDAELIRKATESREKGSYEQRFRRPDGSDGYYRSTFQGRYDAEGNLVSIMGTVLDVTEQRRAEQGLLRQAERLQVLHETDQAILQGVDSPEVIAKTAFLRLKGLLHCQRAGTAILGYADDGVSFIVADGSQETISQTREAFSESAREALEDLRRRNIEIVEDLEKAAAPPLVPRIFAIGRSRSGIGVPLTSANGLYGLLYVGWDEPRSVTAEDVEIVGEIALEITLAVEQARLLDETKRHAALLAQRVAERTAQLQSANEELEAFAWSVSHDLRAPLRAVDGYARILLEDHAQHLDKEGKRICAAIGNSAKNMGELIEDLLALSRAGRASMDLSSVDMAAMVRSVFLELTTPEARVRIDFSVGEMPPMQGDPSLLKLVWINLLANALKYSSKRERAVIEVTAELRQGEVVYSVRDNGAGFDPRYADKLFGVFQRLHSAEEFEGTGVGLAIVQRIIGRHGGRVWGESAAGDGATFSFAVRECTWEGSEPGAMPWKRRSEF